MCEDPLCARHCAQLCVYADGDKGCPIFKEPTVRREGKWGVGHIGQQEEWTLVKIK